MKDYIINGIGVGHHPEEFSRSDIYNRYFEQIGNSADNIIVVNNFVSQEDLDILMRIANAQRLDAINNKKFTNDKIHGIVSTYIPTIVQLFEDRFSIKVSILEHGNIVRRDVSDDMGLHVDDLSTGHNHMAGILYLNDDYEGGEVSFPNHGLSISPKSGDLLIFPGNLNYPHQVHSITSGSRYTSPIWASFI